MNLAIAMDVTAAPATAGTAAEVPAEGDVAFSDALAELASDEAPEEEPEAEGAQLIAGAWLLPTVPPEVRAAETAAPTIASIDPGAVTPTATEGVPEEHADPHVETVAPEIAISVEPEPVIGSSVLEQSSPKESAPEPRPELPPAAIEFVFEPPPRATPSAAPPVIEVAPPPELIPVEERGHIGPARAEIVLGDGANAIALRIEARDQIVRVEAVAPPSDLAALQQDTAGLRAALRRHGLDLGGFSTSARREQDTPRQRERPERDADRTEDEPIAIRRPGLRVVI